MVHPPVARYGASMGSAPGRKPSVSSTEAVAEAYSSASTLARAFGGPVLEPAWWPADVGQISYVLARFPGRALYRIDQLATTRYQYASSAIGRSRGAGRAAGEWYEPRELAPLRGLIGWAFRRVFKPSFTTRSWRSISRLRDRRGDHQRGEEPPPGQRRLVGVGHDPPLAVARRRRGDRAGHDLLAVLAVNGTPRPPSPRCSPTGCSTCCSSPPLR